jgi:hypothetical protein
MQIITLYITKLNKQNNLISEKKEENRSFDLTFVV